MTNRASGSTLDQPLGMQNIEPIAETRVDSPRLELSDGRRGEIMQVPRWREEDRSVATITCACGAVSIEAVGAPLMCVICNCESCRTAGRELDSRSPVAPIVDASGGTAVVLWRKDQLKCVRGSDKWAAHRLSPGSPSRRMFTSCCGTPIFGDFTKGFWASIYRDRIPDAPKPSMRVMMSDAPDDVALPDDGLPRFRNRPGKFLLKLLTTWASMGFRTPKIAGVPD